MADNEAAADTPADAAMTISAPEHGTVVRYGMPGVITVSVGFGIDPDTHQQIPIADPPAVEPRTQRVKAKATRKVITADTPDVGTD